MKFLKRMLKSLATLTQSGRGNVQITRQPLELFSQTQDAQSHEKASTLLIVSRISQNIKYLALSYVIEKALDFVFFQCDYVRINNRRNWETPMRRAFSLQKTSERKGHTHRYKVPDDHWQRQTRLITNTLVSSKNDMAEFMTRLLRKPLR